MPSQRSKSKPYRYRNAGLPAPDLNLGKKVTRQTSQEVFAGAVQGKKASDIEERVARAHDRLGIGYDFRVRITPQIGAMKQHLTKVLANIPGEIEIDFLTQSGQMYPLMVDGEIAHFLRPWQQEIDRAKTEAVNQFGRQYGWHEVVRIPFTRLVTQDMTDQAVREIYGL